MSLSPWSASAGVYLAAWLCRRDLQEGPRLLAAASAEAWAGQAFQVSAH